jgi:hypothetical protein
MASRLAPDMDNTTPLTVEAMGAQNAMRLLNGINLGAAGGLNGAGAQLAGEAAKQQRRDQAKADFDKWHADNVGMMSGYSTEQHDMQVKYLMNQYGLSRSEAEAIAQSRGMPKAATVPAPPHSAPAPLGGGGGGYVPGSIPPSAWGGGM